MNQQFLVTYHAYSNQAGWYQPPRVLKVYAERESQARRRAVNALKEEARQVLPSHAVFEIVNVEVKHD